MIDIYVVTLIMKMGCIFAYWGFVVSVKKNKQKKICAVYGDGSIAESIVSNWLARFTSGNVDLEGPKCFGWPVAVDDCQIETLIENDPCHPTRDIAEIRYTSDISVISHLKEVFNGKLYALHFYVRFSAA